ncbi:MAG: UDP-N-acetylmuramoyl-L-alanyl-D-glutamate--2,6-diaminopimelate ligase [Clostridia bacterium]|nr:UDP-N-acetylmuramoyl-L-alanyl-D-glutamate--2,6-diaminopimelate ligase [Clostridia bacterium]
MKLSAMLAGIEISETNIDNFDIEINSVKADSKQVCFGDMYISLTGFKTDGHGYIGQALHNRAAVIVIEKSEFSGAFPYIRVPSTRRAYSEIWNNITGDVSRDIKLIGVTGTNGKSSVCAMIGGILNAAGHKTEVLGTLNCSLTTPDPPELYTRLRKLADEGCEYAVMEASSHALALDKLHPLKFKAGIFTNLSRDHLDFHKSMYAYAKAKAKLFKQCELCLYNLDDKYYPYITENIKNNCYSFSLEDERADFCAKNIHLSLKNSRFDFLATGDLFRIEASVTGICNVANMLCSAALCRLLDIDKSILKKAMRDFKPISGRMEYVETQSKDICVFVDYAHTPNALYSVLKTLKDTESQRRLVCIFGCGGDRDKGKRSMMGEIATELADFCIITSDNPRTEDPYNIIKDITSSIKHKKNYLIIEDRKQAVRYAIHTARCRDILVFCGKGHERYEINGTNKTEFNEIQMIKDADRERIEIRGNEYYSCRQNENVIGGDSQNN